EDKISDHLDNLPEEWSEVEVRNLLSHSSGLPDIIRYKSTLSDEELMSKLTEAGMEFNTGNQFRYNQTNYWLLARIIEKISEMPFDEFVLRHQFSGSDKGVTFSSNAQDSIPNRATRYSYNRETKEFEKDTNNNGKRAHSGNGLNITLKEFMKWNKRLDSGNLLNEETKNSMWKPFEFANNKDIFLHGWGTYTVGNLDSYGFTGGNLAAFRKFKNKDVTIILLSNGYEIPAYDMIVNDVARMVIPELKTKAPELEESVMKFVVNGQYVEASSSFEKLRIENPNSDFDNLRWNINGLGNSYLYGENDSSKALQVFKFNAEVNPDWWVSLASLAELYDARKDSLKAIETYKKAIEVNEDNAWNYNEQMKNRISALGKDQP
ncbi:MAG: serine hydrolase, partial [Bacteroidota bacterium]